MVRQHQYWETNLVTPLAAFPPSTVVTAVRSLATAWRGCGEGNSTSSGVMHMQTPARSRGVPPGRSSTRAGSPDNEHGQKCVRLVAGVVSGTVYVTAEPNALEPGSPAVPMVLWFKKLFTNLANEASFAPPDEPLLRGGEDGGGDA